MTPLPLTPEVLVERLAARVVAIAGTVRVGVDGPPCSDPLGLAQRLVDPIERAGRRTAVVRAADFWRDASLRFEHGREDPDEYLDWLDAGALRREVLDSVLDGHTYLPSLRDPVTNRVTRAKPRRLDDDGVVLVAGSFLLGLGLPFELVVHLALSPSARWRRTGDAERWTLPAFDRYDAAVSPMNLADVVIRWDDPRRPAVTGLP